MWRMIILAALGMAAPASAETFRVTGVAADDRLNVRSGPSTRFEAVMALPNAYGGLLKEVCVLVKPAPDAAARADLPEWCAISQGAGIMGWVNARFLEPDPAVPEGLRLMQGFRADDDPCRVVGESALTVNYLDHTRWLVGCPAGSPAIDELLAEFGGMQVDRVGGYVLLSLPSGE